MFEIYIIEKDTKEVRFYNTFKSECYAEKMVEYLRSCEDIVTAWIEETL